MTIQTVINGICPGGNHMDVSLLIDGAAKYSFTLTVDEIKASTVSEKEVALFLLKNFVVSGKVDDANALKLVENLLSFTV